MYPVEEIYPENDTNLALILECVKRNHGATGHCLYTAHQPIKTFSNGFLNNAETQER